MVRDWGIMNQRWLLRLREGVSHRRWCADLCCLKCEDFWYETIRTRDFAEADDSGSWNEHLMGLVLQRYVENGNLLYIHHAGSKHTRTSSKTKMSSSYYLVWAGWAAWRRGFYQIILKSRLTNLLQCSIAPNWCDAQAASVRTHRNNFPSIFKRCSEGSGTQPQLHDTLSSRHVLRATFGHAQRWPLLHHLSFT